MSVRHTFSLPCGTSRRAHAAPGVLVALAALAAVVVVLAGSLAPALAAPGAPEPLGLSVDGRAWHADLQGPLFDPAVVWVPGDARVASFSVRNQTQDQGRLLLRVDTSDPRSLLRDADLSLAARLDGGPWVAIPHDGDFHALGRTLGAAASARVDVRASFAATSGNVSQLKALDLQLRALLVQDTAGVAPSAARPSVPAVLAYTGTPLIALLVAAGLLTVIGRVLHAARRPKEYHS